jgi:aspartate aminotransferase
MTFAQRVANLSPSITLAVSAKAKALKAKGVDVIDFGVGEPDFDTPAHIREAAIDGLRNGLTRYTPAAGLPALRQAVAAFYQAHHGVPATAANVVITCGGKQALYNLFQVLLDPGDEIIIPAPYWVSYPEMAWLAGAKPIILPTDESTGFRITAKQLREAITPQTKILLLNSPSNPTGAAYRREELAALADVVLEAGLWVISDEIYEFLVYDNFQFVSFPTLHPELVQRTIVASGASKTYAMTGWRIGWAIGPREVIAQLDNFQSQTTSNATTFAQCGAIAALQGPQDCVDEMRRAFVERRNYMVERLNAIPGLKCPKPEGAFYVFPRCDAYYGKRAGDRIIDGSVALCEYLLDAAHVAAVPGIGFGADPYIRLSYSTSLEQIKAGLDRLEQALKDL